MSNAPQPHHHHLVAIVLEKIRPTQFTVGLAEVREKRNEWGALKKKDRKPRLQSQWFPSVLGPKGEHFIVDHHHLGLALIEEGIKSAYAMVLADFSFVPEDTFWRVMEFRQWAHPYDERGRRRAVQEMPGQLTDMRDDPYRSLAGMVRRAGGFAKDATPFTEFLWADHFRSRIPVKKLAPNPAALLPQAMQIARDPEARYLPGWSGAVSTAGVAPEDNPAGEA